ncbi:MAG: hypothetical protein JXQ87_19595 [Bacteroidia bacterium]
MTWKIFESKNSDIGYLEKTYWNENRIGYKPKFPLIKIAFDNDGGEIQVFNSFRDIEIQLNHFIFENSQNDGIPIFLIDSKLTLSKLCFHRDGFNYPEQINVIKKDELLDLLRKCELSNYDDFAILKDEKTIFGKLIQKDFDYKWRN